MRIAIASFSLLLGACIITDSTPQSQRPQPVTTEDHRTEEGPPVTTEDHRGGGGGQETGPLSCSGNDAVDFADCYVEGDTAVEAHGNCTITLTNCTIRGYKTAINAHGNASVTIIGGSVDGPTAVDAHGNASVNIQQAAVAGDIDRHGNASVNVY